MAIDAASGREVWRQTIGTSPIHAPAVANGTIVIASDAGDVKALDPATGAVRWTAHASDAGIGTPVIAGDLVFVGAGADSTGSRLVAFDLASGAERWHDDRFLAAPAIAGDIAYATGPDGLVSAIDRATGAVRWTGSLDGNLRAPAVAGDAVYVSADRLHQVVALDQATGGELWRVDIDGANPCCIGVARGLVFVGTSTGTVYAIGGDGAALTAKAIPSAVAAAPTAAPSANPAPSAAAALPPLPTNLLWTADSGAADFIPWGLAQAPDGRLWAAEGFKDSFAIFDPDGTYVENWGSSGNGTASSTSRGRTATRTAWWRSRRTARSSCWTPATAACRRSARTASSGGPGATSATIPVSSPTRSASRSTATGTSRSSMTCAV